MRKNPKNLAIEMSQNSILKMFMNFNPQPCQLTKFIKCIKTTLFSLAINFSTKVQITNFKIGLESYSILDFIPSGIFEKILKSSE